MGIKESVLNPREKKWSIRKGKRKRLDIKRRGRNLKVKKNKSRWGNKATVGGLY